MRERFREWKKRRVEIRLPSPDNPKSGAVQERRVGVSLQGIKACQNDESFHSGVARPLITPRISASKLQDF